MDSVRALSPLNELSTTPTKTVISHNDNSGRFVPEFSSSTSNSPAGTNRELSVFRTHLEYTFSSLERDVNRLMHHEHVHDPMYYSADVVSEQKYNDGLPIPGSPHPPPNSILSRTPRLSLNNSENNNNANNSSSGSLGLLADELGHTSSPIQTLRSLAGGNNSGSPRERLLNGIPSLSVTSSPRSSPRIPSFTATQAALASGGAASPYGSPYGSPRSIRGGRRLSSKAPVGQYKIELVEEPDRYIIDAELPNLDAENLKITVGDGLLNLTVGRVRAINEHVEACVACKSHKDAGRPERATPTQVSRSLMLPVDVDSSNVTITQKQGHARIELPKSQMPLNLDEEDENLVGDEIANKDDSKTASKESNNDENDKENTNLGKINVFSSGRPQKHGKDGLPIINQNITNIISGASSGGVETPRTRARSLANMPTPLVIAE